MTQLTGSIQLATKSIADWTEQNPVLKIGQPAVVVFSGNKVRVKYGDEIRNFNDLPYSDSIIEDYLPEVSYKVGEAAYFTIGGTKHQFTAIVAGVLSAPSLVPGSPGIPAWTAEGGPAVDWEDDIPFGAGQLVISPYFSSVWVYRSVIDNNIGYNPQSAGSAYWSRVGVYAGLVGERDYYALDDVVINSEGLAFLSKIHNNNYGVNEFAPPWRKASAVPGEIPGYNYNNLYSKGDYVQQNVNSSGVDVIWIYESIQDDNLQNSPVGGQYDLFWRWVGTYYGVYVPGQTYNEFAVVISTQEEVTNIYISNQAGNTDSVTTVVAVNPWQVIGEYKQPFQFNATSIDAEGNITVNGVAPGKWLLGARVNNEPVTGAEYNPGTGKISGFGGYIGAPDLQIDITFI